MLETLFGVASIGLKRKRSHQFRVSTYVCEMDTHPRNVTAGVGVQVGDAAAREMAQLTAVNKGSILIIRLYGKKTSGRGATSKI